MLLAMADLAAEVHDRLPVDHDPLWDELARIGKPLTENLAIGTSAGLAYHLLVDGLVQVAPNKDLPFSMPMEAHQAIFVANGAAEGMHAARGAGRQDSPLTIAHDEQTEKSTGRKVVDACGNATDKAKKAMARRFRKFSGKEGQ